MLLFLLTVNHYKFYYNLLHFLVKLLIFIIISLINVLLSVRYFRTVSQNVYY